MPSKTLLFGHVTQNQWVKWLKANRSRKMLVNREQATDPCIVFDCGYYIRANIDKWIWEPLSSVQVYMKNGKCSVTKWLIRVYLHSKLKLFGEFLTVNGIWEFYHLELDLEGLEQLTFITMINIALSLVSWWSHGEQNGRFEKVGYVAYLAVGCATYPGPLQASPRLGAYCKDQILVSCQLISQVQINSYFVNLSICIHFYLDFKIHVPFGIVLLSKLIRKLLECMRFLVIHVCLSTALLPSRHG